MKELPRDLKCDERLPRACSEREQDSVYVLCHGFEHALDAAGSLLGARGRVLQATPNANRKESVLLLVMLSAGLWRRPLKVTSLAALDFRSNREGQGPISTHMKAGDIKWLPGGYTHTLTNIGSGPARHVIVEFK